MVKSLDEFARDVPPTPLTTSRDQFADRAYSLMTSSATQAAFRLGDESPSVRDKCGRTTFGQSCLLARCLIEAGVSFVTLNDRGTGPLGWDTHAQNLPTIKNTLAPPLDQGLAALLGDLADRRLLENTLVVMMGEFGRTPKNLLHDRRRVPTSCPGSLRGHGASSVHLAGKALECDSIRRKPRSQDRAGLDWHGVPTRSLNDQ